ncbi:hypothetical protein B5F74_02255 [Collinsella sp. An271]|uniref:hypothetical protein n=1 Tax=Collinsella sp. An271 TaxID=1965616 RepID=UPI000B39D4F7|nr:hypothetical protein [Collinsella sp. An271]OUO62054.1 hypothetical protein B5F74_02255 [Collinsella sp. An271]
MANSIESTKNYTDVIDEVYQLHAVSTCLNSPRRMARAGRNAKEIMIPKIEVTGLGDYTRNEGYITGSINYSFETKTFNYDRGTRLFADAMDVEEAGVLDCFVEAGAELQRTQVAPEGDAFTFATIAGHEGVDVVENDFTNADASDILAELRAVTSRMDEDQVSTGSRYLFITPTLKGLLDDFSLANPNRSNRVLERFCRVVEVPQGRFYDEIKLHSGETGLGGVKEFGFSGGYYSIKKSTDSAPVEGKTYYEQVGDSFEVIENPSGSMTSNYEVTEGSRRLNFMVVEKSAVIKFDKHVASRVFSPDELESLDSHMMKYRKYGIVELLDNKLAGVHVSARPLFA